jgi:group I intron endonuclease
MLIYKLTNLLNGKIYVGKTKNSLSDRLSTHKSEAKRSRSNQYIHKAIRKYGWENFKSEIIEDNIDSLKNLNNREIFYIALYNSTNRGIGYNLSPGGDGGHGLSGPAHHCFGKKLPWLSEKNKKNKGKTYEEIYGVEKAEEMKKSMSDIQTGRIHSEESKNKGGVARKKAWKRGVYDKPEIRAAFSYNKGKPSARRVRVYSPELNMEFESLAAAATHIKTTPGNICSVVKGNLKHIKGYTFVKVENKNVL